MVRAVLLGSNRVNALSGTCVVGVELIGTVVAVIEVPDPEEGAWPDDECT
jgi:hypothetical protein